MSFARYNEINLKSDNEISVVALKKIAAGKFGISYVITVAIMKCAENWWTRPDENVIGCPVITWALARGAVMHSRCAVRLNGRISYEFRGNHSEQSLHCLANLNLK